MTTLLITKSGMVLDVTGIKTSETERIVKLYGRSVIIKDEKIEYLDGMKF